jgi:hypothetical protein
LERLVLLVTFVECNRGREGEVKSLILFIECCQDSFSDCLFSRGGVVRMLCYGIEKVIVILICLTRKEATYVQSSTFLGVKYVQILYKVQLNL